MNKMVSGRFFEIMKELESGTFRKINVMQETMASPSYTCPDSQDCRLFGIDYENCVVGTYSECSVYKDTKTLLKLTENMEASNL